MRKVYGDLFFCCCLYCWKFLFLFPEIKAFRRAQKQVTAPSLFLHGSTWLTLCFFFVSKCQRRLDPTVTLHYFHWPTMQPEMHTKIALRLQSSSRLGDTNGMIDTNVSRANCTADLHGSDRASYPSNHLAWWQELLCIFGEHEWLLSFFQARRLCLPYAVWMACRSIITY